MLILTHCWALGYPNWTAAVESDVSEHSVVQWYNFCREVCIFACDLNQDQQPNKKIGGVGKVVELDESHFGKQKYHRGRQHNSVWVFGGVERGVKENCFFQVVERRDAETIIPIIRHHVLPGTTVVTDCWRAYSSLPKFGYIHKTVNHSKNFKDPVSGEHTNTIENSWHLIKH